MSRTDSLPSLRTRTYAICDALRMATSNYCLDTEDICKVSLEHIALMLNRIEQLENAVSFAVNGGPMRQVLARLQQCEDERLT